MIFTILPVLPVEFRPEMRQSVNMTPPPKKVYQDEWGTGTHEAYEDKPVYQPRVKTKGREGNGFLRAFGGLLMVGGIFWGTYIVTSGGDFSLLTRFPGPVHVLAAGVVISIIAKFL